jgi:Tol biopolymer transport system component
VAAALQRALAKTPADRFNPVAQFATALRPATAPVIIPPRSSRGRSFLAASVVGLAAFGLILFRGWQSSAAKVPVIGRTLQVTRDPGLEVDPALSPDGQNIAYAAGPTNAMQLYVRQVNGGRAVALTSDTTDNFRWPRWSPDGSQIAYQSNDGIYVVPALGGAPRLLTRVNLGALRHTMGSTTSVAGFDWSPDGSRIAWALGYNGDGITVMTLSSGDTLNLPAPANAFSPTWSPDGRSIAVAAGNAAFVFGTGYFGNSGSSAIWIVHLDGTAPTSMATESALNLAPQWSPDGHSLLWISDRDGSRDIYRQRIGGGGAAEGAPQRITTGTDAQGMSLSRDGGRMAYSRLSSHSSIWSIPVPSRGPVSMRGARQITTGNESIEGVSVSPDGRWLVFDSDRGGNPDLYVMPATGGEARQITTDSAADFSADWSPDGRSIVFHSLRNGNRDIYTVAANGTGLHQWTTSKDEELDPDWSPDGKSILFEVFSEDAAKQGFGTRRLVDGASGFMAAAGADFAHWWPDGKSIVYHSPDGLRRHPIDGGAETLAVSNADIGAEAFYIAWSPDGAKLYYLARSAEDWSIRSIAASGGASTVLINFDDPTRQQYKYGLTTDGKVFYVTIGAPESDISVADLVKQ